jgi:DNA-binding CsgD family transcriptional regulator
MLADAHGGRSRVIVLRGEAGMGKSALLRHVSNRADRWHLARAVGAESEKELAYAGLHQLCAPLLHHLEQLPVPQREALETIFGRSAGAPPDRFLIALATLTLFAESAEQQPLLCVIDDAQWLDQASTDVLGFVGRRLLAERIALVFAARSGSGSDILDGLPSLSIRGLGDSDARTLLLDNVRGPLDAAVCEQIITESHGNPLALLELPRTWNAAKVAGGFGLPGFQQVMSKIEHSYRRRLALLPSETRLLVLAAAAEPLGDPVLLSRAAESLGLDMAVAGSAVDAGLLRVIGRVEFAHPLVRTAAYRSAPTAERLRVHLALADATDHATDPDRRAWHRAEAAATPDEGVASELERSATRAQARGGLAAAAAFRKRAMELTGDPARRATRSLAAAQTNLHMGAFDEALGLAAMADGSALDELGRAEVELVRAQVAYLKRGQHAYLPEDGTGASALLMNAAKRIETLDVGLARGTYLDAWGAAMYSGHLAHDGSLLDVSRAALAAPQPSGPPRASDLLLNGLAMLVTEGRAAAAPALRSALDACREEEISITKVLHGTVLVDIAAWILWDFEAWDTIISRQMRLARDVGAIAQLSRGTQSAAMAVMWRGDFGEATALIAQAEVVRETTGTPIVPLAAMLLAAFRGREAEARPIIDATITACTAGGEGLGVQGAHWAAAILYNGLGRHAEALSEAQQASAEDPELYIPVWALSEQIEAAVRSGNGPAGADALARLNEAGGVGDADWGLGVAARSRALMSDDDAAENWYQEAIERLARTRLAPDLARAHLLYGEWLRRKNRGDDARTQLRTAHDMLTAIGMEAFAERARIELLASGENVRKRVVDTRDDLTSQEAQVARFARDGLTNSEIGARLFISARTVEWHLHKVFSKLGITSRRQLRSARPRDTQPVALAYLQTQKAETGRTSAPS